MKKIVCLLPFLLIHQLLFAQHQPTVPIYRTFSANMYGTAVMLGYDYEKVYFLGVKQALQAQTNMYVWVPGLGEKPAQVEAFDAKSAFVVLSIVRVPGWDVEALPVLQAAPHTLAPGRDWQLMAWLDSNHPLLMPELEIGRIARQGEVRRFNLFFTGPYQSALGGLVLNSGGQWVGTVFREKGQELYAEGVGALGHFLRARNIPYNKVRLPGYTSGGEVGEGFRPGSYPHWFQDMQGDDPFIGRGKTQNTQSPTAPDGQLNSGPSEGKKFVLPWPMAFKNIGHASIKGTFAGARNFGEVDLRLEKILLAGGLSRYSYFNIDDGFAIVTDIEQIDASLRPKPEPYRWSTTRHWTTWETLKSFFVATPGYYRFFIFAVRGTPRFGNEEGIRGFGIDESRRLRGSENLESIQKNLSQRPFSQATSGAWALVVSFEIPDGGEDPNPLFENSFLDVRAHLKQTGIDSFRR